MAKRKKTHKIIKILIGLIVLAVGGLAVYRLVSKNSFFLVPGKIVFSEDLDSSARDLIGDKLDDIEVSKDVTISSSRVTQIKQVDDCLGGEDSCEADEAKKRELTYNIYVATTDFYNPVAEVTSEEVEATLAEAGNGVSETDSQIELIPISELDNKVKLLALDGHYYLNSFDEGAFFDLIEVKGENSDDVERVLNLLKDTAPVFPSKDTVLSFVQTGVTALSRGMNNKLNQVGNASYFSELIGDYLSSFDLTHTSNEASFSKNAPSNNGTSQICALPDMIDVLTSIGLDIVELTGNHNQDCGDEDAAATFEQYQTLGIRTVGGGATAELAAVPLKISEKGTNITMLGYNLSTGGYTLDNTPGANFYTKEKAMADITEAKARGDFVIVDVQYYECSEYDKTYETTYCDYADSAAGDQIGLFREIIDLGADVVVGTSAHQTQTYEKYSDGVIYYGLGNIFFDQVWWPMTTRSLMLEHYFYEGKLLQTRLAGTIYDESMQTRVMDAEMLAWFIDRLNSARPK